MVMLLASWMSDALALGAVEHTRVLVEHMVAPWAQQVLAATPTPSPVPTELSGKPQEWAQVCPTLPPQVQTVGGVVLGWAKGFFMLVVPIGLVVSIALLSMKGAVYLLNRRRARREL